MIKMITIRKAGFAITMTLILLFSGNLQSASTVNYETNPVQNHLIEEVATVTPELITGCGVMTETTSMVVDCTVRISTDNIEIEVTFHDVTLWQCAKLKIAAWWNRTF